MLGFEVKVNNLSITIDNEDEEFFIIDHLCSRLLAAAKQNNMKLLKALIKKGADVDTSDKDGNTPLHLATNKGHINIVNELIENSADVNAKNNDGNTPLHLATKKGDINVINELIKNSADVNAKNNDGNTPLHLAIKQGNIDTAKFLIGAKVDLSNNNDETPLHFAASLGDLDAIKFLIEKGASVNAIDKYKETPLHMAAIRSGLEAITFLIKEGANVNAMDTFHKTPLEFACENDNEIATKLFLENGANVNSIDCFGSAPLHVAVDHNNVRIVKLLLDIGARTDLVRKEHYSTNGTPLQIAAKKGYLEIVRTLLECGADKMLKPDCFYETAADCAKRCGHDDIVAYIKSFQKPLPKDILLSPKNSVIVRMWLPKYKGEPTSYAQAILKSFFHPLDTNVGHISISVRNDKGEAYISHWPGETPNYFSSVPGFNATLESDIKNEDAFPSVQVILYSLDTNKMIKKFKEIGEKAPWFLYGNKGQKKTGATAYNCSSFVHEILNSGGFFDHLLTSKDKKKEPIKPADVAELARNAKIVEEILCPITKNYLDENMHDYKEQLLQESEDGMCAPENVKHFIETNPDFHILYLKHNPDAFKTLIHDIYVNLEKSYSTQLLSTILSCEFYNSSIFQSKVDDLIEKGATLLAKDKRGYNALHCAIEKNKYKCVEKILDKFPYAVNDMINYTNNQNVQKSENSENSLYFFSPKKFLPLTPLDLAIDKCNEDIIQLLVRKGGHCTIENKLLKVASSKCA